MRALLFVALAVVATGSFAAKPDWQPSARPTATRCFDVASERRGSGRSPIEPRSGRWDLGRAITTMKSRVRVRCADGTAAGLEVTLYEDEASNKVFARNRASAVEYLKEPAGSSADLVVKAVCRK
jgi:hypothetical protein